MLRHSKAGCSGKVLRDAAQFDRYLTSRFEARIASQPFSPREPIMGALCAGKRHRLDSEASGRRRTNLDLDTLRTQQLDARPSVGSTTPVAPEQRCRPDDKGMQKHTHLARFRGSAAIPLTLLAQGAGTTTAECRPHTPSRQAPIGLSAPLVSN
jgi:hypothetical protein